MAKKLTPAQARALLARVAKQAGPKAAGNLQDVRGVLTPEQIKKTIDKTTAKPKATEYKRKDSVKNVKDLVRAGMTDKQIKNSQLAQARLTPQQIQKIIDKEKKAAKAPKTAPKTTSRVTGSRGGGAGLTGGLGSSGAMAGRKVKN